MSGRDQEIAKFSRALAETPELWRSLDIRVIALRIQHRWYNLITRCRLDGRELRDVPRLTALPETPLVGCWQSIVPRENLAEFFESLRSGEVLVGNEISVRYSGLSEPAGDAAPVEVAYDGAHAIIAGHAQNAPDVLEPRDYVAHQLRLYPQAATRPLLSYVPGGQARIEHDLHSLEEPWHGLRGLMLVALQTGMQWHQSDLPQVEVMAPLGVAFEKQDASLISGQVRFRVWADSPIAAKNCTVGYISEMSDGSYKNGTSNLKRHWRGRGARQGLFSIQLGSAARRVTLLLRLGPHLVETLTCEDTSTRGDNPALSVYELVDPEFKALTTALAKTDTDARKDSGDVARQFETAVAQLFSMAGFIANCVIVKHAVDVLARTPDGTVVMPIECTVGALNSRAGKPSRLASRSDALRRNLGANGTQVLPILATSRFRTAVPRGDIEFVAHDQIAVLFQEELQELLQMISRGASMSDVILFCRDHVPLTAAEVKRRHQPVMDSYV